METREKNALSFIFFPGFFTEMSEATQLVVVVHMYQTQNRSYLKPQSHVYLHPTCVAPWHDRLLYLLSLLSVIYEEICVTNVHK